MAAKDEPAPKKKPEKLAPLNDIHVVWDADLQAVTDLAPDDDAAAQARVDRLVHRDPAAGELYSGVLTLTETDEQKAARAEQ
jgi:hypothetical protein